MKPLFTRMPLWGRALAAASPVALAIATLAVNEWNLPDGPALFLVFGPHICLVIAAFVAVRRWPLLAIFLTVLLAGFLGIPALKSAQTLGEAGALPMLLVNLVQWIAAVATLGFAVVDRAQVGEKYSDNQHMQPNS